MFLHNNRISLKKLAVLLGLSVFIVSCDHRDPPQRINNAFVNTINEYLKDEQLRYGCVEYGKKFKRNLRDASGEYVKDPCTTENIIGEAQEKELIRIRNRFIDRAILGINANYNDFVISLAERRSTGNFIADLVQITLGSVVGVIDDTKTLQILGVSLTGFTAARSSYDINFYEQQTTPVLISAMDTGRSNVLNIIMQSKYDKEAKRDRNTLEYSLYAAINDIVDYYNAGTIVRGFVELNRNSTELARAAEIKVLDLRGVKAPFATAVTEQEARSIKNASDILESFEKAYTKAQDENNEEQLAKIDKDFSKIIDKLQEDTSFKSKWENFLSNIGENDYQKLIRFKLFLRRSLEPKDFDLLKFIDAKIIEVYPEGYDSSN